MKTIHRIPTITIEVFKTKTTFQKNPKLLQLHHNKKSLYLFDNKSLYPKNSYNLYKYKCTKTHLTDKSKFQSKEFPELLQLT